MSTMTVVDRPGATAPLGLLEELRLWLPGTVSDEELAALVEAATAAGDLELAHRAEGTHRNYGYSWGAFVTWCKVLGVPPLGVPPSVLAVYIGHLAITGGRRDERGDAPGRRAASVMAQVSAISARHRDAGLEDPTKDPRVQRVLRGLRRKKGMRTHHREPMTLPRLKQIVRTIDEHELVALRDRVLIAADAAVVTTGRMTPAQLARLDWSHIHDRGDAVQLDLSARSRASHRTPVIVVPVEDGARPCLVTALRDLRAHLLRRRIEAEDPEAAGMATEARAQWQAAYALEDGTLVAGPVLPNLTRYGTLAGGDRYGISKATAMTRLSRAARAVDVGCSRQSLPEWSDAQRLEAMAKVAEPRLANLRDRALLLFGFALAARRSNLSLLVLGEVKEEPEGLSVWLRWSKSDQDGEGRWVAVPCKPGPFCPVAAWRAWRDALCADLGRQPEATYPAFPALSDGGDHVAGPRPVYKTRGGEVCLDDDGQPVVDYYAGISGDEINEIVKRRALAAGLGRDPVTGTLLRWGGHSLRRGWLTEAARQRIDLDEMMAHVGHTNPAVCLSYIAEARRFDPEHSAAMRISFDRTGS